MLALTDCTVTYPDHTVGLKDITLTVGSGESVALIGANGAGKTSFIMATVGVLPASGSITVDGIRLGKDTLASIRQRVGVVFQNPDDQLFMPTIYDDIAFGLRNQGVSEEETERRVDACLTALGIMHLKGRTSLRLSGGEKRMAALATVLVMEPSVILLDEPSAFLDPKARRNLIHILNSLPCTKVIATHDISFAADTCNRAVLLKQGALFADGASKALLYDTKQMDDCGVEAIGVGGEAR